MDELTKAALLAVHQRGILVFWHLGAPRASYRDNDGNAQADFNRIEATFQYVEERFPTEYGTVYLVKGSSPYVTVVNDFTEDWGVENHYELTEKARELLGIDTQA